MKKLLSFCWLLLSLSSYAQEATQAPTQVSQPEWFTIKTGYYNGLYYYHGVLIAALDSHPPQGLACGEGGSCGVSGVVIVNQSSSGSMENLRALCAGEVDSALVQSNLAYMAYTATGAFSGEKPCKQLRAFASLYPEMLQIAVPKESEIQSLADLKGKTIAVGSKQSGTFDSLQEIFTAAGIDINTVKLNNDSLGQSAKDFSEKKIDALAFFAGIPTPIFEQINAKIGLRLLPIEGSSIDAMLAKSPYYRGEDIAQNSYQDVPEVRTISVHALWVGTDKVDKKIAYQLTKNLWDTKTRPSWFQRLLIKNTFEVEHSLDGIGIPLHDGAKQYYNEIGKRF